MTVNKIYRPADTNNFSTSPDCVSPPCAQCARNRATHERAMEALESEQQAQEARIARLIEDSRSSETYAQVNQDFIEKIATLLGRPLVAWEDHETYIETRVTHLLAMEKAGRAA